MAIFIPNRSAVVLVLVLCYFAHYVKQGRKERRKEGNVLFYLRLYGVGHMAKDHSISERGNPMSLLHGLLFSISRKCSFICTIPQTGGHIPRPLLYQSWSTVLNGKQLNGSTCMRIRSYDPLHHERTVFHGGTSRSCIKTNQTLLCKAGRDDSSPGE